MLEPPAGSVPDRRDSTADVTTVVNAASFQPAWAPGLQTLTRTLPHPDGQAFASFEPGEDLPEEWRLHLLILDSGALRLLAPATRPFGRVSPDGPRSLCISVNFLMELTNQALELAAKIGRERFGPTGTWTLGLHLDGLAGVHSAQALSENFYAFRGRPYPRVGYTRTTTATSQQLQEQPAGVVEALLGDLARGLGLRRLLFPYDTPQEIQQRGVSR
jgi:hypothetical protein